MYIWLDPLSCMPEMNTILKINCTSIKKKEQRRSVACGKVLGEEKHAQTWKHHEDPRLHFHSCQHLCSPTSDPWQPLICSLILLFEECYINGVIQHVIMWDWLFSYRTMALRSTQDLDCISSSFLIAEWHSAAWVTAVCVCYHKHLCTVFVWAYFFISLV